uniref:NADH:ubiquinone reductase (H(+)-translocating) n=1 Tax=Macrostomum lignano TaxID=282301 RepID=A0A1I8FSH2_9PLAT
VYLVSHVLVYQYFFVGLNNLVDLELIVFESALRSCNVAASALIATSSFAATVYLVSHVLVYQYFFVGLNNLVDLELILFRIGAPLLQCRGERAHRDVVVYLVSHVLVYQYFFVGLNNLVDLELIVFESALRSCNVAASALIATSSFAATVYLVSHVLVYQYFFVGLNNLIDLELIVFESALRSCNVAASALIATSSFAATVAHELFLTRGFSLSLPLWRLQLVFFAHWRQLLFDLAGLAIF